MIGGQALVGALVFLALVPAGNWLIIWLQAQGLRKRIRTDGPASHMVKAGTPTMGGLLFVGAAVLAGTAMLLLGHSEVLWPVISVMAFATLGGIDDLKGLKDVQGVGWLARVKFPWQWLVGLLLAVGMYLTDAFSPLWLPFSDTVLDLGIWYVPVGAFLIVGWVNAANMADGLDGLAAGMGSLTVALLAVLAQCPSGRGVHGRRRGRGAGSGVGRSCPGLGQHDTAARSGCSHVERGSVSDDTGWLFQVHAPPLWRGKARVQDGALASSL
jgi:UDP-N-acetylmuramyl pentapeptide phosphotransferase/UDP-N-acetylglucosamine-1-phosphate transferase